MIVKVNIMFDFEKLEVYKKARHFNQEIFLFLNRKSFDRFSNDQLKRASYSIMLNIAEGSGRFTKRDKRNFYIISRGSVFECIAIFDLLQVTEQINKAEFNSFYSKLEEISKMLFALIKFLN
jgi:four helix bundle protein